MRSLMKSRVAVVGASGMVGRTMLTILNEMKIPVENIDALASKRSAGQPIKYGKKQLTIQNLEDFSFQKTSYALFSAGSEVSAQYVPRAISEGANVIDNSSYFRMHDGVPLIVPEVNSHILKNQISKKPKGDVIANPNCVLIQLAVALKPLHDHFQLKKVSLSTYQSVCGAGKKAVDELLEQSRQYLINQEVTKPRFFKRNMAFNVLAEIDELMENDFTKEEWKIRQEFQKIFSPTISISATCVRVPVITGHSISAHLTFEKAVDLEEIKKILHATPGVTLNMDTTTPHDVTNKDAVNISRLRYDPDDPNALLVWICADNLRKGAALNAIQIMKYHSNSCMMLN